MVENKETITFVFISDTHGKYKNLQIPKGDVLIHTGDFTSCGCRQEIMEFNQFLKSLTGFQYKIVIAGNHEYTFDENKYRYLRNNFPDYFDEIELTPKEAKSLLTECKYLENEMINVFGYTIYGCPYTLLYHEGAFQYNEQKLQSIYKNIPSNIDILLTHGPSYGHCDFTKNQQHGGSKQLNTQIENRIKPLIHAFGHIHEAHGIEEGIKNKTTYINSALCNSKFKLEYQPIIIKLPNKLNTENKNQQKH